MGRRVPSWPVSFEICRTRVSAKQNPKCITQTNGSSTRNLSTAMTSHPHHPLPLQTLRNQSQLPTTTTPRPRPSRKIRKSLSLLHLHQLLSRHRPAPRTLNCWALGVALCFLPIFHGMRAAAASVRIPIVTQSKETSSAGTALS